MPMWPSGTQGGGGGTVDHAELVNRELPDQHPVNAITGLAAALASSRYRGVFPSLAELEAAYPADVPGAYASVVTSGDASMYIWNDDDHEWQDSGTSGTWVETVNGRTGPNVVLDAADVGAQDAAEKGQANGYAELDAGGKVPMSQMPISGISLNHESCTNRDAANSHPMGAITGLSAALTGLSAAVAGLSETLADEAEAREDADAALNNAKVDKTASSTGEWMESIDVEHDDPDSVTVRVYTSKLDGSESGIEYEKTIYGAVPPGEDPETEPGAAGLLTAADKALLDGLPGRIDSLTGKLRYMPANDFGTDTPAQEDLTAWAEDHTGLDHVENSTAVVNLHDNHEWIYNETGSEWIDNGLTAVSTATNTSLGVVKGSAADWGISAGSDGSMTVNTVDAGETAKGIVQFATDAEISGANPPEGKAVSAAGLRGTLIGGFNVRDVITVSGTYTAPVTGYYRITAIGAGGSGGCAPQGGANNTYPGYGGNEGGTTSFGSDITAPGGGGGAGGVYGAGGGGGGAGLVVTGYIYLNAGENVSVVIGAGGAPGSSAHATSYTQACGEGVYGGKAVGSSSNFSFLWASGTEGGRLNGMPGMLCLPSTSDTPSNTVSGRGGNGGSNGSGYGGGGGGGTYRNTAVASGGSGSDGGSDGSGAINAGGLHNTGGAGGAGAVILEYFDMSKEAA